MEPSATSNLLMPNQQRKGKKIEQVEPAEPAELAGSPEVTDAFHAEDAEVAHGEHPHAMPLSTCEYMSMLNDIRNAVGYMDDLCVTTPCSRSTCWCLSACLRVTGAKLKASKVPPAAGTASSREVELWPHELSGTVSAEGLLLLHSRKIERSPVCGMHSSQCLQLQHCNARPVGKAFTLALINLGVSVLNVRFESLSEPRRGYRV